MILPNVPRIVPDIKATVGGVPTRATIGAHHCFSEGPSLSELKISRKN